MPIDTRPLFQTQLPPTAMSQFYGNVGGIMEAMMQRRREAERLAVLDKQKADELAFRQGQEQRLTDRQTQMDQRDATREANRDRREGISAVVGAKPQDRAFVAQAYGGQVGPGKADTTGIDFTQDDESSPLGFSVNPEWERRTSQAENTQTLTMPGGQSMNLPGGAGGSAEWRAKLRQTIAGLPDSPEKAMRLRALSEAEAMEYDPEATGDYMNKNAAMFGQDQRAAASVAARRRPRGAGGSADPAKNKANDLEYLDREGNTVIARTPQDAAKARDSRPSIIAAQQAGEELKSHVNTYKNISKLNPMDWLSGDVDQQGPRNTLIDRLISARKEITGAVTGEDIKRYKLQLDTATGRGPEAVNQAIDSFVRELQNLYDAKVATYRAGGPGPAAAPTPAPAASPAGSGDRLDAWEANRGRR